MLLLEGRVKWRFLYFGRTLDDVHRMSSMSELRIMKNACIMSNQTASNFNINRHEKADAICTDVLRNCFSSFVIADLIELLDLFERFNHCYTFVCILLFQIHPSSSNSVHLESV